MKITTFKKSDLEGLAEQKATAYLRPHIQTSHFDALEASPYSYSLWSDEGEILGCAGVIEYWNGRGEAWAILRENLGAHMVPMFRAFYAVISRCPVSRIEAVVDHDFWPGHRLVRLLGFETETARMKKYRPNGGDATMYVRFN